MDLDLKFDAANNEAGKQRVAFLIKSGESYAHPDYPQKKDMRMYRVLLSMIDGQRKATQHLTDLKVEGAIKDPAAASLLMEKHEKDEALVTSFEWGDTEKDAEPASADKKRHKKDWTPEQEEARKVGMVTLGILFSFSGLVPSGPAVLQDSPLRKISIYLPTFFRACRGSLRRAG